MTHKKHVHENRVFKELWHLILKLSSNKVATNITTLQTELYNKPRLNIKIQQTYCENLKHHPTRHGSTTVSFPIKHGFKVSRLTINPLARAIKPSNPLKINNKNTDSYVRCDVRNTIFPSQKMVQLRTKYNQIHFVQLYTWIVGTCTLIHMYK